MIENESSMPYLVTVLMTVGLGVLLVGVMYGAELGPNNEMLAQPLQGVGGALIVGGSLVFARYLDGLPDQEESGH